MFIKTNSFLKGNQNYARLFGTGQYPFMHHNQWKKRQTIRSNMDIQEMELLPKS